MRLMRTDTGEVIWSILNTQRSTGEQNDVRDCAFSPDGTLIASVGADHIVKLWDRASGKLISVYAGHENIIQSCAFSPDGKTLVSAGDDSKAMLWDVTVRNKSSGIENWHSGSINGCTFSADGAFFVTASDDRTAKIWLLNENSADGVTLPHKNISVRSCAIHPDGDIIATGANDASLRVWKQDGVFVTRLRHSYDALGYNKAGGYPVTDCAISPDGAWVVAALHNKVEQWDLTRLQWIRDFPVGAATAHSCAISPDGALIVTGSDELTIWDSRTGVKLHSLDSNHREIAHCSFSSDGAFIVSASSRNDHLSKYTLHYSYDRDQEVTIWGYEPFAKVWQSLQRISWQTRNITGCSFTPDGRFIVASDDSGVIKVWSTQDGQEHCEFRANQLTFSLAVHPSMPAILGGGEGGSLFYSRVVGLTYGPIVLTAVWSDKQIIVRCPQCRQVTPIGDHSLGKVTLCSGCGLVLRVNPFVLKRIRLSWLDHSDTIPRYNPSLESFAPPRRRWWQRKRRNDV